MGVTKVRRTINAPVEKVFETISRIDQFSQAIPQITNVELLTEQTHGLGTKFKETRVMNGREATVQLECTEYNENESVRMVSDEGGTVWDTVFRTVSVDGQTELSLEMESRPYKLMAKLMVPMISKVVSKAVERDMDSVKAFCEAKVNENDE